MSLHDNLDELMQAPPGSEKDDAPAAATAGAPGLETKENDVILGETQATCNTPQSTVDVSLAARQYAAQGWVLVPIVAGTKGPTAKGWNQLGNLITTPDQCSRIKGNVGLAHAYSRTCVIDLDALDLARTYLAEHGVDLDALMAAPDAVRISSGRLNRGKLLYRLPEGVAPLPSKQLKAYGLELRCATADGLTVQDVLPPSIHPDTGEAYRWEFGDPLVGSWSSPPTLPAELLALWQGLLTPRSEISDKAPLGLGRRELRELLSGYSPDTGYGEWIEMGMALHHETRGGEMGLELWDEWSTPGATYKGREDLAQHWDSFGRRTTGPIKTVRSLLSAAEISVDDLPDLTNDEPAALAIAFTRNKNGKVVASRENLDIAVARPECCGFQLRFDTFRCEVMRATPGKDDWRPFSDEDYTRLSIMLERGECGFSEISKEKIRDAVALVTDDRQFDSARQWLEALQWDGLPRVEASLSRYFGAQDSDYARAIARYFWTALAGRVMQPGCKADMVPVAVGAQGAGKSRTVAAIVPSADFFGELDLGEKEPDTARMMLGKLVIEMGELRGLRVKDREALKAFITRTREQWVPKFKEKSTSYDRRSMFFGTTNRDEFLADETGHRRWLPFKAGACDPTAMALDREQLWAEALIRYQAGGIAWAQAESLARGEHKAFVEQDPWEATIHDYLSTPEIDGEPCRFVTYGEVLSHLQVAKKDQTQAMKDRVARVMSALGWTPARKSSARGFKPTPFGGHEVTGSDAG